MNLRMRIVCGVVAAAGIAMPASVRSEQASLDGWRRPGIRTEDPDALMQQATQLMQRAAKARGETPQSEDIDDVPADETGFTEYVDDEAAAQDVGAPLSETTVRLRINSSGKAVVLSDEPADMPAAQAIARSQRGMTQTASPQSMRPIGPHAVPASRAIASPDVRTAQTEAPQYDDFIEQLIHTADAGGQAPTQEAAEALPPPVDGPMLQQMAPQMAPQLLPEGHADAYCGDACCPPARPLICVAGVEASFLWPDLNRESGAVFTFEDEEQETWNESFAENTDSMYLTPRIWLGVQGCAWGANVRYWHLRACEGSFDPATEATDGWDYDEWAWEKEPDFGFFTDACLDAYTIDLEVTRRFCLNDCAMQASLGVRHGSIESHESAVGTALGEDARFMGYARNDRYSRGTGFMLGLYGRKPLFPCSCIHWFYNARWSTLWGPTATSAETFAAVTIDGGNAGSVNGACTYVDDTLNIGEIQLGLEWNYALQCLPANAFFRAAIEYQRWDGGKGHSEASSFAEYTVEDQDENEWTSTARAFTSVAEPQLDLFGLTVGTGLTW